MIKLNEWRIGNWVDDRWTDKKRRLSLQDFAREYQDEDFFNQIRPVYLTAEVLENCGFKIEQGDYKLPNFYPNCYFEGGKLVISFGEYTTSLKYLHQLQNIYFDHTSEELNVQL